MSDWKKIAPTEWQGNVCTTIGKEWLLIGASSGDKVNAMTASWGGLGVIWNKNVAYVFIRDSRYTKELIDETGKFTLTVLDHEKYASVLGYMGKASGRNEDKIAHAGLHAELLDEQAVFEEGKLAITCKVMCRQPLEKDNFLYGDIDTKFYSDKDYHELYIGEIVGMYVRD